MPIMIDRIDITSVAYTIQSSIPFNSFLFRFPYRRETGFSVLRTLRPTYNMIIAQYVLIVNGFSRKMYTNSPCCFCSRCTIRPIQKKICKNRIDI
nr:MAG TPA: hypothetical protein [Caudoviricetes sp.]